MKERKKISIGSAVKLFSLTAVAVMLFIVFYMSSVANTSLKNQAFRIYQTTLSFYRDKVDRSLSEMDQTLYDFVLNDNNIALLGTKCSAEERYLAKVAISAKTQQTVNLHDFTEGVLFYSPLGDEAEFITRTAQVLSLGESKSLKQHVLRAVDDDRSGHSIDTSKWALTAIGGKNYLLLITQAGGSYIGAWVSLEHLQRSLGEIDFGQDSVPLLCDPDGSVLTPSPLLSRLTLDHGRWSELNTEGGESLQISVQSSKGGFSAAVLIPTSGITEDWDSGLLIVKLFSALLLILLVLLLLSGRFLYRPFKTLVTAMRRVGEGDLDTQIQKSAPLKEFDQVYGIFNSMTAEIKNLTIRVYERRLSEQKIMRQYLQMQLKSHFYLNCLNIIYSLAQVREYKLIQELTMYLTRYFRYMLKDASRQSTIGDELDHIRNYMKIQEMRFPEKVSYREDVPDDFWDVPIPPLMMQTFIENAIEHAIDFDRHNIIGLTVTKQEWDGQDGILLVISDNGAGFDEALLDRLNHDEPVTQIEYEKGIGINNMKNRLKIIYGGRAALFFHNAEPHGAVVEVWLPGSPGQEEEP